MKLTDKQINEIKRDIKNYDRDDHITINVDHYTTF